MTPGEWFVAGEKDGAWEVRTEDGTLIAKVYTGREDARAITAVPDMCEALKGVCGGNHNLVGVSVQKSIHELKIVKQAGDAVKKANGE